MDNEILDAYYTLLSDAERCDDDAKLQQVKSALNDALQSMQRLAKNDVQWQGIVDQCIKDAVQASNRKKAVMPKPAVALPPERLTRFDKAHAALVWDLFHQHGYLLEMRVMGKWMKDGIPIKKMFSGIYDDNGKTSFIRDVERLDKKVPNEITNIYITMNPVSANQFSQVTAVRNRLYGKKDILGNEKSTNDEMIADRCWLLLDFDPARPVNTNATNDEKMLAWQRLKQVGAFLRDAMSWEPSIIASSGNGYHLLYRVQLPSQDGRIAKLLHALSDKFSDENVMIDRTVSNEARITKCYGTMTAKGENTPERPRRRSQILQTYTPAHNPLTTDDFDRAFEHTELKPFVKEISVPQTAEKAFKYTGPRLINSLDDLEKWVLGHGLSVHEQVGNSLKVECPWEDTHSTHDQGTSVFFNDDGSLGFHCFHGHCVDKKWSDVRLKFDPSYDPQGDLALDGWLAAYQEPSDDEICACIRAFPALLTDPKPFAPTIAALRRFPPNIVLYTLSYSDIRPGDVVKLFRWGMQKLA